MSRTWRLAVLALPLLLASCFIAPGRFTSTLDIRADRSFTFTYVGEVIAPSDKSLGGSLGQDDPDDQSRDEEDSGTAPAMLKIAAGSDQQKQGAGDSKGDVDGSGDTREEAARLQAIAKALSQEYGFRSVRYIGNRKLAIDYAISGRLDRTFLFPFNVDGEIIVPFLAIELRGKDRLRVKAPAFANERTASNGMGMGSAGLPGGDKAPGDALDGTFTLTTDAQIVSQNQEDGATPLPDGRTRIIWRATPALHDAPMAVLRVAPLP